MSGYLPPHTKDGAASKLYEVDYNLEKSSTDTKDTHSKEYKTAIPAGAIPTVHTQIRVDCLGDNEPLKLPVLGFGLWGWGDVLTYGWAPSGGYDQNLDDKSCEAAFKAIVHQFPLVLFDTAEHYGYTDGYSEKLLGQFYTGNSQPNDRAQFVLATKYFPTPWRHPWRYPNIVLQSLSGSVDRTKMGHVDIYQLHGPSHWGFWPRLSTLVESLADAYRSGKAKTIGTCNLSLNQVRYVHAELSKRGVPYVSNQVEFSLVRMDPWRSSLIEESRKLGIATIAYSPLAVGRLTGKYSASNLPRGNRNFGDISWTKIQPVVDMLVEIGKEVGRRPVAVALNWVMCKGAIPIPTCKNAEQVQDCCESLGWRLSSTQEKRLDAVGRTNDWDYNLIKHFQNWWWQQG